MRTTIFSLAVGLCLSLTVGALPSSSPLEAGRSSLLSAREDVDDLSDKERTQMAQTCYHNSECIRSGAMKGRDEALVCAEVCAKMYDARDWYKDMLKEFNEVLKHASKESVAKTNRKYRKSLEDAQDMIDKELDERKPDYDVAAKVIDKVFSGAGDQEVRQKITFIPVIFVKGQPVKKQSLLHRLFEQFFGGLKNALNKLMNRKKKEA